MSRILCIDDEPAILRLLAVILQRDGHGIVPARDARAALAALGDGAVDAVLLDLGLPDRDGLELLPAIRQRTAAPVIVVSAREDVQEKVAALDLGASDYVTKPFEGDELLARIRAALRKSGSAGREDTMLVHGRVAIDVAHHRASVDGRSLLLTPREFALLRALVAAGGRILTHAALLEAVWGKAHREDVEYLRVAVRSLRVKLEQEPSRPQLLRNEPGIGYRLAEG